MSTEPMTERRLAELEYWGTNGHSLGPAEAREVFYEARRLRAEIGTVNETYGQTIERLQAENERLQSDNDALDLIVAEYRAGMGQNTPAEFERIRAECDRYRAALEDALKTLFTFRYEAGARDTMAMIEEVLNESNKAPSEPQPKGV